MIEYLKSVREVTEIAFDAGRLVIAETLGKIDSWLANALNTEEDEK